MHFLHRIKWEAGRLIEQWQTSLNMQKANAFYLQILHTVLQLHMHKNEPLIQTVEVFLHKYILQLFKELLYRSNL